MVVYNFKKIQVVPSASDFIDIVLSKTQRQTPTVVHPQFKIRRIANFYTRKVKFTQQTFHDKLTQILEDFPLLDNIHPFYADLMNVLYDRDHYKLALGQLNTARHLVDNIAKDYVRLLKYGDSLYRCKQLKRAALGRMCTLMKRQHTNLAYLEQIRQHMARLPSIDPNTRTLLVCGYPNVGKSSFLNKITRANVDVQPYAFTTKSLFVGHTDYKSLPWQVIDTPGVLDHPLEERNTIEMQSITALAHLRAAILYLVDISEQCGYTIDQQVALFKSIKPLFLGKPLVVVLNKIDVVRLDNLREEARVLLQNLEKEEGVTMIPMSNMTDEGIAQVKAMACDRLLAQRVETRMNGPSVNNILNRVHVAQPQKRDNKVREAFIPESVLQARAAKADTVVKSRTERRKEMKEMSGTIQVVSNDYDGRFEVPEDWDPTKYSIDWRKDYDLNDESWKFDNIPEIFDGKNIADFVDPDILKRLDELEKEELILDSKRAEAKAGEEEPMQLDEDTMALVEKIRHKKKMLVYQHRLKKKNSAPQLPRKVRAEKESTVTAFEDHLKDMGLDPAAAASRVRDLARSRSRSRAARSESRGRKREREERDVEERSRKRAKTPGFKSKKDEEKAEKVRRKTQYDRNKLAKRGEGDNVIPTKMPQHLFSGKRGIGKTDRR